MVHTPDNSETSVSIVLGAVLGFFKSIYEYGLTEEYETIKLAAIGALTAFVVTTVLKWARNKIYKKPK